MRPSLEGVHVAAITPRRENGCEIDLSAALELVDYLSASGVHGIALLGSTGEFIHFDIAERIRLVSFAARAKPGSRNRGSGALDAGGRRDAGARGGCLRSRGRAGDAAVLLPLPAARNQGVLPALGRERRRRSPLLLYNIPVFSNPLSCETAVDLLSTGMFAGIKDSSGDFDYFLGLKPVCQAKGLKLLVGSDSIFARARLEGATGLVSGVACAVPELLVALDSGDRPRTVAIGWRPGCSNSLPGSTLSRPGRHPGGDPLARAEDRALRAAGRRAVAGRISRMVSGLAPRGTERDPILMKNPMYPEEFRRAAHAAVDWIADFLADPRKYPVLPDVKPGQLTDSLPRSAPDRGESLEAIFEDFQKLIVPATTIWNHPRFMAYFGCTGSAPGILAEMLAATLDSNALIWKSAPSVTELEQVTLGWLRQWIGPAGGVLRHHLRHGVGEQHACRRRGAGDGGSRSAPRGRSAGT